SLYPGPRVWRSQVRIARRIPHLHVDAIQDARKPVGAMTQQPVESASERGRLDLARVGRAHRIYAVGIDEPALDERKLPVELESVHRPERSGQIERGEQLGREQAL